MQDAIIVNNFFKKLTKVWEKVVTCVNIIRIFTAIFHKKTNGEFNRRI